MDIAIQFGGRSFQLNDQDGTDLVAKQMQEGSYEAPLPMLTLAVLSRTGGLFCDVGANNGLYTVLACASRPDVMVAAFEPYPPVLEALKRNISLNHLNERVQIHEVALSDEEGMALLFVPDPRHGLLETSCSLESAFKIDDGKRTIEIRKHRLDDIEQTLAQISLIKVDIEGHELSFLKGAVNTLKRHRPLVFAEMLPASSRNFFECSQIVDGLQYVKFRLRSNAALLSPAIVIDHNAWNYALVPREKIALFENCCISHNLEIFKPYWS